MSEDELIFLGAVILLPQKGRESDEAEMQTATLSAYKLREEQKKQRNQRQEKKPLPLVELAKEKLEGGS
jgi:hypothetical protein